MREIWRYLPRCRVKHALRSYGDRVSVCGISTWSPEEWRGTGTQDEYERVELLPECKRCVKLLH